MNNLRYLYALLMLFLIQCGSNPKIPVNRVEINYPGKTYQSFILKKFQKNGDLTPVDTLKINEGKATFEHSITTPGIYFVSNGSQNLMFFLEPEDIRIYINPEEFKIDSVLGGQNNLLYKKFKDKTDSLKKRQKEILVQYKNNNADKKKITEDLFQINDSINRFKNRFARENPSLAGIVVMIDQTFENQADLKVKELNDIYQTYDESLKKTEAGKFLTKRLNTLSAGAIGMRVLNFTAPDPEGKLISLYSVMGKVTLVDFWASWCRPCRAENPNLVRIYKKYHDQGLNIVGVSLDKSKDAWLKAIEKDGLEWYHVSHLKGWHEPVAKQFHVTFIPQSLLIDKHGVVRYKNLRGKMLEEKILELLEE